MVIPPLLVSFGFFVVFYSSAIDFATTYLPENLVKYSVPAGILGWFTHSLISADWSFFFTSVILTAFSFIAGGIFYYTKQWASGDMWLIAVASSLLGPAFTRFWPDFFIYSAIWAGILGLTYYCYFLIKYGIYKKHIQGLIVLSAIAVFTALDPFPRLFIFGFAFLFFILITRKDVEALFIVEKRVKDIEEDDWLMEDIQVGKHTLKASRPVGKKEVELAAKYGKGKTTIRSGVPMTPAFSLALITLLAV